MKSCNKHGRRACMWCAAATLSFPIEHAAWTYVPGLSFLSGLLGL